jgi:hypothetical protein
MYLFFVYTKKTTLSQPHYLGHLKGLVAGMVPWSGIPGTRKNHAWTAGDKIFLIMHDAQPMYKLQKI